MNSLARVMDVITSQPWALRHDFMTRMQQALSRRITEGKLSAEDVEARIGGQSQPRPGSRSGDTVVIPVHGVIGHRAHLVHDMSSGVGTSTEILTAQVRQAATDPAVENIVLDFESPGGGVFGLPEAAAAIREAREEKRVIGVANAYAASAAYWLAAQSGELVVTPSGQVGSIGVYMLHEDISKFLEERGVTETLIYAGKYKVEGNPFEPLSEDAREHFQEQVDQAYTRFVNAVAKGRGVDASVVRSASFGEGRMVEAEDAVAAGMADRVASMNDVLEDLGINLTGARRDRGRSATHKDPDFRARQLRQRKHEQNQ